MARQRKSKQTRKQEKATEESVEMPTPIPTIADRVKEEEEKEELIVDGMDNDTTSSVKEDPIDDEIGSKEELIVDNETSSEEEDDDSELDELLDDEGDEEQSGGMVGIMTDVPLTGRKAFLRAFSHRQEEDDEDEGEDNDELEEEETVLSKSEVQGGKKKQSNGPRFKNKQRVMLLSSRGITYRHRHLLKDMEALLPHARKDAKFDAKGQLNMLNELADLNNCNNTLFFEIRKNTDLYWWFSKSPHGPCAKFHVQNVHTMDELKLTGNCLKGSRPLLSFDSKFDTMPHYRLMKQLFIHSFGTPKGHRKSKPFFDHVFTFTILDGHVWFRNYQIVKKEDKESKEDISLVEIGPRFVLNPIRIFNGSFGGEVLYENPEYVSPNALRAMFRSGPASKYSHRVMAQRDRQQKTVENRVPRTELDDVDEIFRK